MKTFVIIGGASRSGTNSVSCFIQLNDNAIAFGSAAGAHPLNQKQDFIKTLFEQRKGIQTPYVVNGYPDFEEYLQNKLERIIRDGVGDEEIISLRWDGGESIYPYMMGLVPKDVELKLIVCMRPVFKIFRSQYCGGMLDTKDVEPAKRQFKIRLNATYKHAEHIRSKMPEKVLFVDITGEHAGRDYARIVPFLGLTPNALQFAWISQLPVTNKGGKTRDVVPGALPEDFADLEEIRKELLI